MCCGIFWYMGPQLWLICIPFHGYKYRTCFSSTVLSHQIPYWKAKCCFLHLYFKSMVSCVSPANAERGPFRQAHTLSFVCSRCEQSPWFSIARCRVAAQVQLFPYPTAPSSSVVCWEPVLVGVCALSCHLLHRLLGCVFPLFHRGVVLRWDWADWKCGVLLQEADSNPWGMSWWWSLVLMLLLNARTD